MDYGARHDAYGCTEAELRKEIAALKEQLIFLQQQCEQYEKDFLKERRDRENLCAQLEAAKQLKEQYNDKLAIEVANRLEEKERGIFGKIRQLTGWKEHGGIKEQGLQECVDLGQKEGDNLKQKERIRTLTEENERLLETLHGHQEDYQTQQLRIENEELKREIEVLKTSSHMCTQQPSRSEDHMMMPPRAVLPGVPHCRDHGHHKTAPVEDSCYQQGPQCGQPHPQSFSMEQHSSWAPHNQCPPQQRGHYQFQSQSHQDLRFTDADWRKASSSPGGISDVPSEASPLDPNLTCPHCGKRFRKGDIQNFRLHANTCH